MIELLPDEETVLKIALRNAYLHEGKADFKSVINHIMGEFPDARRSGKEVSSIVANIVKMINEMPPSDVSKKALDLMPDLLIKEKKVQEHHLPDLERVEGEVYMRLAPSPSGPLHIGHSRMAILNDEYVKRYGGKLFLRIEDTNPANIDLDAYEMIPHDLEWLDVRIHEIIVQSRRMDLYYKEARKLIANGHMYICECEQKRFKELKLQSMPCPHRNRSPEENLEKFDRMLNGGFKHGEVSAVVKTDLNHPNPSIRDWIAFRVKEETHPLTGKTFFAYPMMNFSVAVDDHYLNLTHVIRGKDHLNNTEKQSYIFNYNEWKKPVYYHYGMVRIPGAMLKTSLMKKGIREGKYSGWDDIRLFTLRSMRKRGYRQDAIRKYWVNSGMREIDSEFSWEIFNSINRDMIDGSAKRLWFVPGPRKVKILGDIHLKSSAPFHPGNPSLGQRIYDLGTEPDIYITSNDWNSLNEGEKFRLKDLCNVIKKGENLAYSDNSHDSIRNMKIIHWAPDGSHDFTVERPDGNNDSGRIEPLVSEVTGISQFERYGYVNISNNKITGYFLHK